MTELDIKNKLSNEHILCDDSKGEIVEYPLRRVTEAELEGLRASKKPGVIYKETIIKGYPTYWYSEIPANLSLVAKKWYPQKCAECTVLGTEEGSDLRTCAWAYTIRQALKFEKLEYIETAIETFNIPKTAFKVEECGHFVPYPEKKVSKNVCRKHSALLLAQFLDESIETFGDLKRYEQKNNIKVR